MFQNLFKTWSNISLCRLQYVKENPHPVTALSPLFARWDGDLERLLSLRSFLNKRLTKVLERFRLVLPFSELFSLCCLFFFCLSSKGGGKADKYLFLNKHTYCTLCTKQTIDYMSSFLQLCLVHRKIDWATAGVGHSAYLCWVLKT